MQRTTKTTVGQPNKSTPAQANRTGQTGAAKNQVNKSTGGHPGASVSQNATSSGNTVVCRKCKSTQIVANKRGYSFSKMFKMLGWMGLLPLLIVIIGTVVTYSLMWKSGASISEGLIAFVGIICWISISLSLPVSILVGFVGRSELVNGCMNCGFKWTPAKKK